MQETLARAAAPRKAAFARTYLSLGWMPIPVRDGKNPNFADWNLFTTTEAEVERHFHDGLNVGLLLGQPSNNLVDVDLDSREARDLAAHFLPPTEMKSGRQSSPHSHYWFVAEGLKTIKYQDPVKAEDDTKAMIVELRSTGCQTLVEPSVHPSGERYEWAGELQPAAVGARDLRVATSRLAAAALLARHWPGQGSRQDAALALAGGLLRANWPEDQVRAFIIAIAEGAHDDEPDKRATAVHYTQEKLTAGQSATGWPALAKLIDERVVKTARAWLNVETRKQVDEPPPTEAQTADANLPKINAGLQDMPALARLAWEALAHANHPEYLFVRGNLAVRLEKGEKGDPVLAPLTVARLRHELARAACWHKERPFSGNVIEVAAKPPADLAEDLLAYASLPLPALRRIVEAPVFSLSGELEVTPGYHRASRTYYHAPRGALDIGHIPEKPSSADIIAAVDLILNDLLGDFPFVSEADRAHALALALLPSVRAAIDGPTPLHLVEAPAAGSGKGLLVEAALSPSIGRNFGSIPQAEGDEEYRKRITACLVAGHAVILIDNLTAPLDSGAVASALTAQTWTDRVLGKSEMVNVEVSPVWVATANNVALSTEIARRSIRIRLDAKCDRPWQRTGFTHEDLRGWATENRARLARAILILGRAWFAAGRPRDPKVKRLGSFEGWSDTVGGILMVAEVPGFLANCDELYELADRESMVMRAFVAQWWEKYGDNTVGAAELFPLACERSEIELPGKTERGMKTAFGAKLTRYRDTVFGDFRIVKAGEQQRAAQWRLLRIRDER